MVTLTFALIVLVSAVVALVACITADIAGYMTDAKLAKAYRLQAMDDRRMARKVAQTSALYATMAAKPTSFRVARPSDFGIHV